ncbi:MAG: GlsB/YeaQ/YmgE family stress response membrane protein [Caulobacterales bacterium]
MAVESLIIFLLVGAVAGWLAGIIVKGYGYGLAGNIIVGVVGSFVGGWLFGRFNLVHGNGMLGELVGATLGAIVLLFIIRFIRRVA